MSEKLQINKIQLDGGTQPRAGLNDATVAEYVQLVEEAQIAGQDTGEIIWPFRDAVEIYYDGESYWLADGFHRVAACRRVGRYVVEANVHQGTRREAILHAAGANADHGLRRTSDDKKRAVRRLLNDEEWGAWSDREIARRCRVSPTLVGGERRKLTVQMDSEPPAERTYTTRHGTTAVMNTEKIGSSKPPTYPKFDYGNPDNWDEETRRAKISGPIERRVRAEYELLWFRNGVFTDLLERGSDHPKWEALVASEVPEWARPSEVQAALRKLSQKWPNKMDGNKREQTAVTDDFADESPPPRLAAWALEQYVRAWLRTDSPQRCGFIRDDLDALRAIKEKKVGYRVPFDSIKNDIGLANYTDGDLRQAINNVINQVEVERRDVLNKEQTADNPRIATEMATYWLNNYVDPVHKRRWSDIDDAQIYGTKSDVFAAFKKGYPNFTDHKELLKSALANLKREKAVGIAESIKALWDATLRLVAQVPDRDLAGQLNFAAMQLDKAYKMAKETAVSEEA